MRIRTDQLALSPVGDELMLLDLDTSTYFAVSSSGALIVERLRQPGGAEESDLVEALVGEFEVDEDVARVDVTDFLSSLRAAGLVTE